MTKCPSSNVLMDFLRGGLSSTEHAAIESHLSAGCRRCEEEQNWLAEILEISSTDQSFEFPEEIIARVVDELKTEPWRKPSAFARLRAQLVFDSLQMQPVMGLRASLPGPVSPSEKQVLFHADGYDIDLRFEIAEPAEDEVDVEDLIGQVLPEQNPKTPVLCVVRLCQGEQELAHATTNPQGLFKFARIPSGVYDLEITVPEGEVCIDGIATARVS